MDGTALGAATSLRSTERLFPKQPLKERARDILREITGQEP